MMRPRFANVFLGNILKWVPKKILTGTGDINYMKDGLPDEINEMTNMHSSNYIKNAEQPFNDMVQDILVQRATTPESLLAVSDSQLDEYKAEVYKLEDIQSRVRSYMRKRKEYEMLVLQEIDLRTRQKKVVEQLALKVHMTKGVANTFNKLTNIVA